MKKTLLILSLISLMGITTLGADNVSIDKEVTGINKETLEVRNIEGQEATLEQEQVNANVIKIYNDQLKQESNEMVLRENNELKDELSQEVENDSKAMKYLIGALVIIGVAVAL